MSDIGLSNAFWITLLLVTAAEFLIGFIPGFFLSFWVLTKLKQNGFFTLIVAFVGGILLSRLGNLILNNFNDLLVSDKSIVEILLFVIVSIEIIIAIIISSYFFNYKKTNKVHRQKVRK